MTKYIVSILTGLLFFITSCKDDSLKTNSLQNAELTELKNRYKTDKSDSTFIKLTQSYGLSIRETNDLELKEKYILEVLEMRRDDKNSDFIEPFVLELNKVNPLNTRNADLLFDLGKQYENDSNMDIAEIYYHGLISRFPKDAWTEDIKSKVKPQFDAAKLIESLAKEAFKDPDSMGMNFGAAMQYISACEAFAMAYPNDKTTPEYLFRAAEMHRAYRQFSPMMQFYNWIISYYPDYPNMPIVLFSKGFLLETEFNRLDDALQTYKLFLEKFPKDELTPQVQMLIDNIGSDPLEMVKKKK